MRRRSLRWRRAAMRATRGEKTQSSHEKKPKKEIKMVRAEAHRRSGSKNSPLRGTPLVVFQFEARCASADPIHPAHPVHPVEF